MKKQKKTKINHSVFFITINTNKKLDQANRKKFEDSIKWLLGVPKIYEYITDRNIPGPIDVSKILKLKTKYSIEVGEKLGHVHSHIMVSIDHLLCLQFDQKKIRTFYKNLIGDKVYLNIIPRGRPEKSREEYIFKDVVADDDNAMDTDSD
jgi:hypothetical protein